MGSGVLRDNRAGAGELFFFSFGCLASWFGTVSPGLPRSLFSWVMVDAQAAVVS